MSGFAEEGGDELHLPGGECVSPWLVSVVLEELVEAGVALQPPFQLCHLSREAPFAGEIEQGEFAPAVGSDLEVLHFSSVFTVFSLVFTVFPLVFILLPLARAGLALKSVVSCGRGRS